MANPFTLEHRKATVLKHIYSGMSDAKVALALSGKRGSVSAQAVSLFRKRHAEEIGSHNAELERQVSDYAIADKVSRVAVNDMLRNLLLQVKDDRAVGGTGIDTGLVVRREKALGSGKGMILVEEFEIDPALVTLIDRLHNSTADELGQKPKPDLHIGDKNVFIFEVVAPHGHGEFPALG